jgi:hypothetical protein
VQKFLIDECLSLELAELAIERGYLDSRHVVRMGRSSWTDRQLMRLVLDGDWTFVTRNARDFRGAPTAPGLRGRYAGAEINAGLVCLNGPDAMTIDVQLELFGIALDELAAIGDAFVNRGLEVTLARAGDAAVTVTMYDLPPPGPPAPARRTRRR